MGDLGMLCASIGCLGVQRAPRRRGGGPGPGAGAAWVGIMRGCVLCVVLACVVFGLTKGLLLNVSCLCPVGRGEGSPWGKAGRNRGETRTPPHERAETQVKGASCCHAVKWRRGWRVG
jgi:hypothetical protein